MKESRELRVNIGGASIILIFLILSLSISAVLSIKSSNSEFKLANKTAVSIQQYYAADRKATEILSELSDILFSKNKSTNQVIEAMMQVDSTINIVLHTQDILSITYQVPMEQKLSLMVTLEIPLRNDKVKKEKSPYQVVQWQLVKELDEDTYTLEVFDLWDGLEEE